MSELHCAHLLGSQSRRGLKRYKRYLPPQTCPCGFLCGVVNAEDKKREHLKPSKKMTDEDKEIEQDLAKSKATPDEIQKKYACLGAD